MIHLAPCFCIVVIVIIIIIISSSIISISIIISSIINNSIIDITINSIWSKLLLPRPYESELLDLRPTLRPVHLLRVSLLGVLESNFPGDSL